MKYLHEVSAEGGPLLIADAAVARGWRGIEGGDASDYRIACEMFDRDTVQGCALTIGSGQGMVWDMEGAGVADVFALDSTHVVVVRAWLDDSVNADDFETVSRLAELPLRNALDFGSIKITSGALAILWATENGSCIGLLDIPANWRPTGEMSSESSGLLVSMPQGLYSCLHDYVQVDGSEARRCHILRQ